MAGGVHTRGDWCPTAGRHSGGNADDTMCRLCGSIVEEPPPSGIDTGGAVSQALPAVSERDRRQAVLRRAKEIEESTGAPRTEAWRRAELELYPDRIPERYRSRPLKPWLWPLVLLVVAAVFIPIALVGMMAYALISVGYCNSTGSGCGSPILNAVGIATLALWLSIPVSLAAIALHNAKSPAGEVTAWIGLAAWAFVTAFIAIGIA